MTFRRSSILVIFALGVAGCAHAPRPAPAFPSPEDPPLEDTSLAPYLEPPEGGTPSAGAECDGGTADCPNEAATGP